MKLYDHLLRSRTVVVVVVVFHLGVGVGWAHDVRRVGLEGLIFNQIVNSTQMNDLFQNIVRFILQEGWLAIFKIGYNVYSF